MYIFPPLFFFGGKVFGKSPPFGANTASAPITVVGLRNLAWNLQISESTLWETNHSLKLIFRDHFFQTLFSLIHPYDLKTSYPQTSQTFHFPYKKNLWGPGFRKQQKSSPQKNIQPPNETLARDENPIESAPKKLLLEMLQKSNKRRPQGIYWWNCRIICRPKMGCPQRSICPPWIFFGAQKKSLKRHDFVWDTNEKFLMRRWWRGWKSIIWSFWSHLDLSKLAGKITHECGSLSFLCFSTELERFSWQLTWCTGSHDGALLDIFKDDVVKCTCKTVRLGSMYGIFSYFWLICLVNAGNYTIHAWMV